MSTLKQMLDAGVIEPLDYWFADYLTNPDRGLTAQRVPDDIAVAAGLVSRAAGEGHVCLDLGAIAGESLELETGAVVLPALSEWKAALLESGVAGSADTGSMGPSPPPLVLSGDRLYLSRLWDAERRLAAWISVRVQSPRVRLDRLVVDRRRLRSDIDELFGDRDGIDWQRIAVVAALRSDFCVITGGPGTGKTTVAARIMGLLERQNEYRGRDGTTALLAAPTGKAAERLARSMTGLGVQAESMTLHRLIGRFIRRRTYRPDVIIVDEASMADLGLMARLTEIMPPETRLILLGDKDQLSSVEAGAVLGDICSPPRGTLEQMPYSRAFCEEAAELAGQQMTPGAGSPLRDAIVVLQHSYRFPATGGVGGVSRAINSGDVRKAVSILRDSSRADVSWVDAVDFARLEQRVITGFGAYLQANDPAEAFRLYRGFCVLTALRRGRYGVVELNRWIEKCLARAGLIRPSSRWYPGMPLLISRNDHVQRLYNGDVGIVLTGQDGQLHAFFPDGVDAFRTIPPIRLPEHEPAYAMTVHKSQGSEYDRVLLLLPPQPVRVLTRELIYTAITRARESVEVWGAEDVLRAAVSRTIERGSGLREALWDNG